MCVFVCCLLTRSEARSAYASIVSKLAYYSKNMNEFINIAEIESLIRFLKNQTRPNVRDVQSPEFKSAFYDYFINEA